MLRDVQGIRINGFTGEMMSLDKAIKSGKEHRNPHRSPSNRCWNHGSCEWCLGKRMYRTNKEIAKSNEQLKQLKESNDKD